MEVKCFLKQSARRKLVDWLAMYAWLVSTMSAVWRLIRRQHIDASGLFTCLHLTSWKRVVNELASEELSITSGIVIMIYILALPVFRGIDYKNWLAMDQFSVTFQDKNGVVIGKRGINLNHAVPLAEIPEHMIEALLATEDRRFFEHIGIDFIGTFRALIENIRANDFVQGGATLTQQLAKNLFLSPERSITRKIKEVYLSLWLEARLSKNQILKLYLDRSYLGGGAFGDVPFFPTNEPKQ